MTSCERVFRIQELRSNIFLELDLPTMLLVVSRVCKYWAATIRDNPTIRRHLFCSFPLLQNEGRYKSRHNLLRSDKFLQPGASWRSLDPGADVAIVRKHTREVPPETVREYSIRLVRSLTAGHIYALVWRHIELAATSTYAQGRANGLGCAARWLFLGRGDATSLPQGNGSLVDCLPARERLIFQQRLIDVQASCFLLLLDGCRACPLESDHALSWADFALRGGPEPAAADLLLQDEGWFLAMSRDINHPNCAEISGPLNLTSLGE